MLGLLLPISSLSLLRSDSLVFIYMYVFNLGIVTMADLPEFMIKLADLAGIWAILGVELNFTPGTLRAFPPAILADPKQALQELLRRWLERTSPPPTLEALAEAVGGPVIQNELLASTLLERRRDFPSIQARESGMIVATS